MTVRSIHNYTTFIYQLIHSTTIFYHFKNAFPKDFMGKERYYVDDPVDRCALTLARPIGCSYGS